MTAAEGTARWQAVEQVRRVLEWPSLYHTETLEDCLAALSLLEQLAEKSDRIAYLADHLLQQVPEFTGVIGPGGEREDDYIRDSIGQEIVSFKALVAAVRSGRAGA